MSDDQQQTSPRSLRSVPRAVVSHLRSARRALNPFDATSSASQPTPVPDYGEDQDEWDLPRHNTTGHDQRPEGHSNNPFLNGGRPQSQNTLGVPQPGPNTHRGSVWSEATLTNNESDDDESRYSLSSYQHPYEIPPPEQAYRPPSSNDGYPRRRSVCFADRPVQIQRTPSPPEGSGEDEEVDLAYERALKKRGIPSNIVDLRTLEGRPSNAEEVRETQPRQETPRGFPDHYTSNLYTSKRPNIRQRDSMASMVSTDSVLWDPDDPRVTGIEAKELECPTDIEKNALKQMDYKARRKHLNRVRIEYNISSMIDRQNFLIKLAKALMSFGAPSHRIESQLVAAARILEVEAEFIHLPNVIICSFGDQDMGCSDTHFIRCSGRLALGALHKVHTTYRHVVHDEISAKEATAQLDKILTSPPLYGKNARISLAFCLSALICPLAFGGSFLDMWIAGLGALVLSLLQIHVAAKSAMYANVFEITVAILVSFTARGLSSIKDQIFCYTAISSSAIIGILPGYLILSSSLELASKNIVCGSVKMVYALIYTLFLGFGLQIGSDMYLLFDRQHKKRLATLNAAVTKAIILTGSWVTDNVTSGSTLGGDSTLPLAGTWTFTRAANKDHFNIVNGCYRPETAPWYQQPFPWWTAFLIVPTFSFLLSLANLQPIYSKQLPVMVVISCCSYASNKIANQFIFNRSDIVSAIGAFTVGLLGNMYSRKMGGTAFTAMVPGVLFLVPSGLSQAGGITANGGGIDIGGAMIAVTIGITVGLFMSQALVYAFGTRKNAAMFSF